MVEHGYMLHHSLSLIFLILRRRETQESVRLYYFWFEGLRGRGVIGEMTAATPPSRPVLGPCLWFFLFLFLFLVGRCSAQAPAPFPTAASKTDPVEAEAVNAIFRRWSLQANGWNLSGELCSGLATNGYNNIDDNLGIKCNCTFNAGATCRVTKLKIYDCNVVGTIPDELQNLTQLTELNLGQNYLTGPLPAFIGKLTSMQYMTFGLNALSGPLPKELGQLSNLVLIGLGPNNFSGSLPPELGNLTNLEELGIGSNNFSGPLPEELGNLSNLERVYIDSCGLFGEIPSSLANLTKLRQFYASDNNFTGKIPDFFGTFTDLQELRFQGNSFQGPIPSSFANLTNLNDLRIGDIVKGSSTLDFLRNMTSLTTLTIRNARISDTMPSNFSQYIFLELLDLSFNNITGELPESLFSLNSLEFLFLGNNSLSGSLPAQKSRSLQNIDLSYNKLSGDIPSWASESNLQLNLVANNFSLNSLANSLLGSGFQCLQQNIPCNRGSPIYSSFGINCGGRSRITASDGIVYDADDQRLSTASYHVSADQKWGVSSIGRFMVTSSPNYTWNVLKNFLNTQDTELFQLARLSPSSLRYYGLGLENGNYTVKLQYAETAFPDMQTWLSVGRRVFNVYIQGTLREQDFDIRGAAGGSNIGIVRRYTTLVTDNFLEVHFFWVGKGTWSIPMHGSYGLAISAISVTPNLTPTVRAPTGLIAGVVVGVSALLILLALSFCIVSGRRSAEQAEYEDLRAISSRAEIFSYGDLRAATDYFSPGNKLGEGGFGPVFKGTLSEGRVVAVKQLSMSSHQGKQQFVAEIATISAVQHKSLVKLIGCCVERDKWLLIYEYLENGSLDQALFGDLSLLGIMGRGGRKPSIDHLQVFGSIVHVKCTKASQKKLEDCSIPMVFIGYEIDTKAYCCFDPVNASVHISRDVIFEEDAKWDWTNQGESVPTLTFMPDLSVESSMEDQLVSDEDVEAQCVENYDEESISRSESQDPESLRYKSVAQLYSETNPMQAEDEECLISFEEPSTYDEAAREEVWNIAMKEEMEAVDRSKTWELVAPPPNCRPIGLKWIFKVKKSAKGEILRHKARLVVKGYSQR